MPEYRTACTVAPDPGRRQLDSVVERLARRYADRTGVHRDVIEAAARIGWAKYEGARVTKYRGILAERVAAAALQEWFGAPARAAEIEPAGQT